MNGLPPLRALWVRELRRISRQPTRLVASLATPVLLWVVLASGLGEAAQIDRPAGYSAFVLPGIITLVITFTSIFGAISLIEDRHTGLLQAALTSPAPAWSIAGSKLLGAATVAVAQGVVLIPAAYAVGLAPGVPGALIAVGAVACTSLAIAGVSLAAAWRVNSVQGFHGIMNAVLMPMWLLSGSAFPPESSAPWMQAVAAVNPLAWSTETLRAALEGGVPSLAHVLGTLTFSAFGIGLATAVVARRV